MQTKGDKTGQEMPRSDLGRWLLTSIESYRVIRGTSGISEPVCELLKRAVVAISRHEPDCEELRGVARELEEVADALEEEVGEAAEQEEEGLQEEEQQNQDAPAPAGTATAQVGAEETEGSME